MENRRVRMTKQLIKEAFLELLEQMPLEKLTVTHICRAADVNRSTFYAHYEDTGQLLREIEDDLLAQLPAAEGPPLGSERFLDALEAFFDYVRQRERLFRIFLVHRDGGGFSHRLIAAVMAAYPTEGSPGGLPERYAYVFCISGVIGMLRQWIEGRFPLTSREFARLALSLSAGAMGQ